MAEFVVNPDSENDGTSSCSFPFSERATVLEDFQWTLEGLLLRRVCVNLAYLMIKGHH
jgi:hypothetical protein